LLSLFLSKPVLGTSPALAMFYGGNLRDSVLVNFVPSENGGFAWDSRFLWDTRGRGGVSCQNGTLQRGTIPNGLSGRLYINFAIFWGLVDPRLAKPEDASQHGRLYLPRGASEPAVVVSTLPFLEDSENPCLRNRTVGPFGARPIPEDLGGFIAGWVLTT
jgi:hypothetical protein